jgi:hypothetical protein
VKELVRILNYKLFESDLKRNRMSDILQQAILIIGAHNIFATNPLFSQEKQKEF